MCFGTALTQSPFAPRPSFDETVAPRVRPTRPPLAVADRIRDASSRSKSGKAGGGRSVSPHGTGSVFVVPRSSVEEATKEAQRAGIAYARANGDALTYKGRKPSYSRKQFEGAQAMLGKSASVGEVAKTIGLTRQTIYRIKDNPAAAEAALATWGM
jgi:hypothetical protein